MGSRTRVLQVVQFAAPAHAAALQQLLFDAQSLAVHGQQKGAPWMA
jgi:hypothetical protein